MAKGYNSYGIIGAPISPGVSQQLSRRRDIVSKRENRTAEDIAYLNSVTGWVKVSSAVDIREEDIILNSPFNLVSPPISIDNYSSDLAKRFQLFGGVYSTTGARGGFVQKEDKTFADNSSYNYSEVSGIVPMPGITSFQAQSLGTYGTLRGASFTLTVHSPEDFNIIEQLFLRPGFTILIEWGHSTFISNDGDVSQPVYLDPDTFFAGSEESKLRKELLKIRTQSNSLNSDFIFGFIKNFSWTFNGINYICQVDVISKGEIISSIRSTFANFKEEGEEEETTETTASEVELILNKLKKAGGETRFTSKTNIEVIQENLKKSFLKILDESEVGKKYVDLFDKSSFLVAELSGLTEKKSNPLAKYITLRDFLRIINKSGILKDQNGKNLVSFYTDPPKPEEGEAPLPDPSPKFNTFPEHIAIDPYICILPKSKDNTKYSYGLTVNNTDFDSEDILNIFVNVDLLLQSLTVFKTKEKSDDTLNEFLKSILSSIAKNLGGINNLQVHYDEDQSLYYIVDRNTIPSADDFELSEDGKPQSFIDIVGLDSEILNLNVVSKLSGDLTTMIAIAAQATNKGATDSDILQVQRWNVGLRDRHLTEKTIGNTGDSADEQNEKIEKNPSVPFKVNPKLLEKYNSFIDKVNGQGENIFIGFDQKYFNGMIQTHREVTAQYVRQYAEEGRTNIPGLIPFELTFTIKGISGLKVGQAFRTNEFFLPSRYRGKVAFVITGLDHKVENNYWSTDVKSQIIII